MTDLKQGRLAVVVTGASTGIGRATAERLDRVGFRVFAGVRKESDARALRDSSSEALTPLSLDVTDAQSIEAAVERVAEETGGVGLAGLVNNAGVAVGGVLEFLDLDQLRRQLEVNLIGAVAVTKAFLPAIRESGGRVVNISSDSGFLSTPFLAPYCASKFGLEAISDSLRRELRPWGIEVVIVEPGAIATPIWDKAGPQASEIRQSLSPRAEQLYGEYFDKMESYVRKQAEVAISADAVAQAVERGLTARRPRTRYQVGNDAKMARWMTRLLPARWVDALIAGQLVRS